MKTRIEYDLVNHDPINNKKPIDSTFYKNHNNLLTKLYNDFKNLENQKVSKDDKVKFMREVLGLHLG
jgi:hypothetical protein